MPGLKKKASLLIVSALLLVTVLSVPVLARLNETDRAPAAASSSPGAKLERETPNPATPVVMASLQQPAALILPKLLLSATPQPTGPGPVDTFLTAETDRKAGQAPQAIRAYLDVIEHFPASLEADSAYMRIRHVIESLTPEQLKDIEALLPQTSDATPPELLIAAGSAYTWMAKRCLNGPPEQLQSYLPKVCDFAWKILQRKDENLAIDGALEAYLVANGALGQGDAARAKLSALADSAGPCFAAWLIKAKVDGVEPPFDFVSSYEGQALVCTYYRNAAQSAKDALAKKVYLTKTRDASLQLMLSHSPDRPAFEHCRDYLAAAEALGPDERQAALDKVQSLLKDQPLSITRWITRYELADFLTREGNSAEDTRAGFQHFDALVSEAAPSVLDSAVNDPAVDGRTRGLILSILGHGYAGTNRVNEAETCYQWVQNNFPYETHSEETAAYAMAVMEDRKNVNTPSAGAVAYEQFADNHPSSAYSADALTRAARNHERANELDRATAIYKRIADEAANSTAEREQAEKRIQELSLSTAQTN